MQWSVIHERTIRELQCFPVVKHHSSQNELINKEHPIHNLLTLEPRHLRHRPRPLATRPPQLELTPLTIPLTLKIPRRCYHQTPRSTATETTSRPPPVPQREYHNCEGPTQEKVEGCLSLVHTG